MAEHSATVPPPLPWNDLAPVLLTPVRLETRYLIDATPPVLAIRVVPDDIARYTFEPDLTVAEHAAGTGYWTACAAGADPTTAWVQVQNLLGNARSAWAVEVTRPDSTTTDPGTRTTVHPATSLILPDHFTFTGWQHGTQVFQYDGNPVSPDLCLGPNWSQLGPDTASDDPADRQPWTAASKWMVDLDAAVDAGMAYRVPLAGTNLAFDRITVVGISSASAADGADRLARTLQGQLYTGGLGYPPAESPTNNTDATRSQWSSAPTLRTPDQVTAAIAAAAPGLGQPGVTIADAFGLPSDTRPGIPGRRDLLAAPQATDPGDDDLARRAHELIATYSQTLTNAARFGPLAAQDPQTRAQIAAHFASFVRAGGPLPVLRVGRQPYGVLPVTDLENWTATDPPDVIENIRQSAIVAWEGLDAVLGASPRLSGDPHQDEDPVLAGLLQRQPTATQLRAVNDAHTLASESIAPGTAAPFSPGMSLPFDVTPSQPADPADPPVWPLAQMAAAMPQFDGPQSPKISQLCVNVATLTDACHHNGLYWAVQAYAALHWQAALLQAASQPNTSPTGWSNAIKAISDALTPLRALEPDAAADWAAVDAHLAAAVTALGQRPDAWATSMATARLQSLRSSGTIGVHLGMYGWVVDVAPLAPLARASESGWALTPSPQHAVTACVLFAGAEAHNSTAFDIDLSSAQVRAAQLLLAGLRDGSTLEELLGYQLERALHDSHLDTAIPGLRNAYPLPVVPAAGPQTAAATDASRTARLVVDGETVRRAPGAADLIMGLLGTDDNTVRDVVNNILNGLDSTVDAAGDGLLAESVHHLVGGSPLRAGLTLDTIGKAGPAPPSLDVITTPTAAVSVTHTVALVAGASGARWYASPRATLDPAADAIAGWVLGSPGDWRIDLTDPATGAVTSMSPSDLQMSAIDLVAELTDPPDNSALAARARTHPSAAADSTVLVHRTDGHGGPDAAAVLAGATRALLTQTQPVADPAAVLDPAAVPDPAAVAATAASLAQLHTRITTWQTQVQAVFDTTPTVGTAATLAQLAQLGLRGARFDTPPATLAQLAVQWGGVSIPAPPETAGPAEASAWLTKVAAAVRAAAGDWFTAATQRAAAALPGDPPTSGAGDDDVAAWLADHAPMCAGVSALTDLLTVSGACGAADVPQWLIQQYLTAGTDPLSPWANPSEPGAWIGGSDPGGRSGTSLTTLQVGDRAATVQMWVGLDHWNEAVPLRFPVRPPDPASAAAPDVIAGRQHDAAVSLRFDSPDSRAPQALLLAVPPNPPQGWSRDDVQHAVEQTLTWAMARPLDCDDLPESNWP